MNIFRYSNVITGRFLVLITAVSVILGTLPVFFLIAEASVPTPEIIFADGFESNDFSVWSGSGSDWYTVHNTAGAYEGDTRAEGRGDSNSGSTLTKYISTSDYADITLSFWYKLDGSGLESDESVTVDYTIGGGVWTNLDTFEDGDETDGWKEWQNTLPPQVVNQSSFGIRFMIDANSPSDIFGLDSVELRGSSILTTGGTIKIIKEVDDISGENTEFVFNYNLDTNTNNWDFGLIGGEETVFTDFDDTQTQTITEYLYNTPDWELDSIECVSADGYSSVFDYGNGLPDGDGATSNESGAWGNVEIDFEPGDDVVCTFSNKKITTYYAPDTITIKKEVINTEIDETIFNFNFNFDDDREDIDFSLSASEEMTYRGLDDTYQLISEYDTSGWKLKEISCASVFGDTYDSIISYDYANEFNEVEVELDIDDHVICTFYNERIPETGTIIVQKEIIGETTEFDPEFEFQTSWDENSSWLGDGDIFVADGLSVNGGPFSVSEILPDGWEQSIECASDVDTNFIDPADIYLLNGETVTCTFINQEVISGDTCQNPGATNYDEAGACVFQEGEVVVRKVIVGGPLQVDDFQFYIWEDYIDEFTEEDQSQGAWVIEPEYFEPDGENITVLAEGQYDIREFAVPDSYHVTYEGCTNVEVSASLEIPPVCTVTNTYITPESESGVSSDFDPYCGDGQVNQDWEQCEVGDIGCVVDTCQFEELQIVDEIEHEYGTRFTRRSSEPVGQVLGVSTTVGSCQPYLNEYMQQGRDNDPVEVFKLQAFLIGKGYVVDMTGVFDQPTSDAVKLFQRKNSGDILAPWVEAGLAISDNPTGYVYMTTKWKINDIMCPQIVPFPDLFAE